MTHTRGAWGVAVIGFVLLGFAACSAEAPTSAPPSDEAAILSNAERENALMVIRERAQARGISKGWLIAGIAQQETGLTHCWRDQTSFCKGIASPDCNGPVVAGTFDGKCSQGGLGMFQLDDGTQQQTLKRWGKDVLTLKGNVDAGIDALIFKLRICVPGPRSKTDADAVEWLNGVEHGSSDYTTYLGVLSACYNGWDPRTKGFVKQRAAYGRSVDYVLTLHPERWWTR